MMNWPTAFVIAVAICAGAFLYTKPSDAAFHGNSDQVLRLIDIKDGPLYALSQWLQVRGDKMRVCNNVRTAPSGIKCHPWYTD